MGGGEYGKSRLDFFLMHKDLIQNVEKVVYGDKISLDFDHKLVHLRIGKSKSVQKIRVFDSTLKDDIANCIGIIEVYDTMNNHLLAPDLGIARSIGQMKIALNDYFELDKRINMGYNDHVSCARKNEIKNNLWAQVQTLPLFNELLEGNLTCTWTVLYEVVANNLRNSLLDYQAVLKRITNLKRDYLREKVVRMATNFGDFSEQCYDAIRELNNLDDLLLKEKASKYKEFVLANNERPTRAFCLLGKENNLMDDIGQIKDDNGVAFVNERDRGRYIKDFYGNLYKRRLDNLFRIEDFLENDTANSDWVTRKKLTDAEKLGLVPVVNSTTPSLGA